MAGGEGGMTDLNLGRPAALVNSQLVCLRPVGILNSCYCSVPSFRCFIGPEKPLWGASINYVLYCIVVTL